MWSDNLFDSQRTDDGKISLHTFVVWLIIILRFEQSYWYTVGLDHYGYSGAVTLGMVHVWNQILWWSKTCRKSVQLEQTGVICLFLQLSFAGDAAQFCTCCARFIREREGVYNNPLPQSNRKITKAWTQ